MILKWPVKFSKEKAGPRTGAILHIALKLQAVARAKIGLKFEKERKKENSIGSNSSMSASQMQTQ